MSEKIKDLICGMEFDKDTASGKTEYMGKMYYFCSPGCREKFLQDAEKYVTHEKK